MLGSNDKKSSIINVTLTKCFLNVVIVCLLSLIVLKYIFIWGDVPTVSMYPTIQEGDKVGIVKIVGKIKRGDIVVFNTPKELLAITDADYLCKRVIATEGESVEIKGGRVYVDDKILNEESYVVNKDSKFYMSKIVVPDNSIFVLGDNRTNSHDSRFWENKYIQKENIIGTVPFKINKVLDKPVYE